MRSSRLRLYLVLSPRGIDPPYHKTLHFTQSPLQSYFKYFSICKYTTRQNVVNTFIAGFFSMPTDHPTKVDRTINQLIAILI